LEISFLSNSQFLALEIRSVEINRDDMSWRLAVTRLFVATQLRCSRAEFRLDQSAFIDLNTTA